MILSRPPQGAIVGSASVEASPTIPSRAARSTQRSNAPQCLLPRTAAKATFVSRARSIAARMAKAATTCPIALSPSMMIAPPTQVATRGLPRGFTPPTISFST